MRPPRQTATVDDMDLNEARATEVVSPSQKTPDSLGRIAAADPEVERILATGHQPRVRELLWHAVPEGEGIALDFLAARRLPGLE